MPTYADEDALREYIAANAEVADTGDLTAVLERAERDVDRAVGPWPILSTGRRFDPAQLDVVQRSALERATCAAAEFRMQVEEAALVGDDDYAPAGVQVIRRGTRVSPKMLEELAGSGLIRTSGTVATPLAAPALPAPASVLGPYIVRDGAVVVGPEGVFD